ncbi:MAG: hypothetical protein ACRBN8_36970 [Nannocystales bacterium]
MRALHVSLFCTLTVACADSGSSETADGSTGDSATGSNGSSSTRGPEPTSGSTSGNDSGSTTSSETTDADSSSGNDSTGKGAGSGLELLVCNFTADSVSRFDLDDGAHLGDLGPAKELDGALGIAVGPDGALYVASEESNMVLRFDGSSGALLDRFIWDDPDTPEDETGGLQGPAAVLFGPDDNLYISSFDSDAILRYGSDGTFVDVFVPPGTGGLDGPDAGMVFGPDGDLFVPGYYSNTIARFDGATGDYEGDFTSSDELSRPRTLVFQGEHLYVANEGSGAVLRFDADNGEFVDVFVGAGELGSPAGMVFDPAGVLHVVSVGNNTVLRFGADGTPLDTLVDAAAAGLDAPTHIVLAPALGS